MRFDLEGDDFHESTAGERTELVASSVQDDSDNVGCLEWLEVVLEDKEICLPCKAERLSRFTVQARVVTATARVVFKDDKYLGTEWGTRTVEAQKALGFSLQCRASKRCQTAARAVEKYLQQSEDSVYVRAIALKELGEVYFLKDDMEAAEKSFTEALSMNRSVY